MVRFECNLCLIRHSWMQEKPERRCLSIVDPATSSELEIAKAEGSQSDETGPSGSEYSGRSAPLTPVGLKIGGRRRLSIEDPATSSEIARTDESQSDGASPLGSEHSGRSAQVTPAGRKTGRQQRLRIVDPETGKTIKLDMQVGIHVPPWILCPESDSFFHALHHCHEHHAAETMLQWSEMIWLCILSRISRQNQAWPGLAFPFQWKVRHDSCIVYLVHPSEPTFCSWHNQTLWAPACARTPIFCSK